MKGFFYFINSMFFTYILYSVTLDKYYKGHTNNVYNRLKILNAGTVSSTSTGVPWQLVLVIEKPTRKEAAILERKLKNLNKVRLLMFIQKYKQLQSLRNEGFFVNIIYLLTSLCKQVFLSKSKKL